MDLSLADVINHVASGAATGALVYVGAQFRKNRHAGAQRDARVDALIERLDRVDDRLANVEDLMGAIRRRRRRTDFEPEDET